MSHCAGPLRRFDSIQCRDAKRAPLSFHWSPIWTLSAGKLVSTLGLSCAIHQSMHKTAAILFTVALAVFITPLRTPAASCILSKGASPEPCKPGCCANMTCCAVSKENTGPVSQPFAQSAAPEQPTIALLANVPARFLVQSVRFGGVVSAGVTVRPHSPPPLAANCIQLI